MTITPIPDARIESWSATLLNPDGSQTSLPLDADQPLTWSWEQGAQSPVGAKLICHGTRPELRHGQLVQIAYHANDVRYPLPLLAPIISWPSYDDAGRWFSLDLVDQTINLAADGIDFAAVYVAGTPIIATVRAVLTASDPDLPVALPGLDYTLRNPLDFPLSTAPLEIANKLLDAAGATPLAPGPDDGVLRSDPWTPPSTRPVRMVFGPDLMDAGYSPRIDAESDYLAAPNVGHFVADGSSSADQLVGRWRDEDSASPWGIPMRGRRILARDSGEVATQEIADEKARRLVMEARGRGRSAKITGGFQPVFPGHIVETRHPDYPELSARWEVVGVSGSSAPGSDTTWELQEVVG